MLKWKLWPKVKDEGRRAGLIADFPTLARCGQRFFKSTYEEQNGSRLSMEILPVGFKAVQAILPNVS